MAADRADTQMIGKDPHPEPLSCKTRQFEQTKEGDKASPAPTYQRK